jgi:hypothetical protein
MIPETNTDALKQAWQQQPLNGAAISLENLKRAANRFQRGISVRNFVEYAAAVVVVIGYSQMMLKVHKPLIQIGCVLIVIATLYVVVQMHVRMSSQKPPLDELGATFVGFHRAAVMRQIAGLESVLYWYLLPFLPGWTLFIVQSLLDRAWTGMLFLVASGLFVGGGIVALNRWFARRLRSKLEELDGLVPADEPKRTAA